MTAETLDKNTLFSSLDEAVSQLQKLLSSLDDNELNAIPYEGSWTAGMLYRHIIKVTDGMAGVLQMPAKPAGRSADERVPDLKKAFLDFSTKMKAPDMAVPEEAVYQKKDLHDKLDASLRHFKEAAGKPNLDELVTGLPMGDITKQEILHFTLYHTQRHLHQMQKIVDALHTAQMHNGQQG